MRQGGLLFSAFVLAAILVTCCCFPIGSACCVLGWRILSRQAAKRRQRAKAVDKLLRVADKRGVFTSVPQDPEPPTLSEKKE